MRQAESEAESAGVRGSAVTPFLLERIVELTGGASLRANMALLRQNARVAGHLAVALFS
jgi:pseudouridine-5'-phosphate glycosidase